VTLGGWAALERAIVRCERCPRLVAHRREVARVRRRAYRDQEYWGRPVPGFGDRGAHMLLLGLAPAAHGANRTGRMFTGDSSGEWLYHALFECGLANRPRSEARDDGFALRGAFVTAACRCAPPDNRPAPAELEACAGYLDRELDLLPDLRVVVALGGIAWATALRRARRVEPGALPVPAPRFGHGATTRVALRAGGARIALLGCYHPSRQNTQTGRLTRGMLGTVIRRAARIAGLEGAPEGRG
jgi:uracil-DNA glycosylase